MFYKTTKRNVFMVLLLSQLRKYRERKDSIWSSLYAHVLLVLISMGFKNTYGEDKIYPYVFSHMLKEAPQMLVNMIMLSNILRIYLNNVKSLSPTFQPIKASNNCLFPV